MHVFDFRPFSVRKTVPVLRIALMSAVLSFSVFGTALLSQWIVYDDWLRQTGPVRLLGTSFAAIITFLFTLRWQLGVQAREREARLRLETIRQMNDRIRNALQIIECLVHVEQPEATFQIRGAVDAIDAALRDGSTRSEGAASVLRERMRVELNSERGPTVPPSNASQSAGQQL